MSHDPESRFRLAQQEFWVEQGRKSRRARRMWLAVIIGSAVSWALIFWVALS